MKKLTPRQALKAFWTVFIFGAVIVLSGNSSIANGNLRGSISAVIGTMLILIAGGIHFCFYRCPHCGKYLDRSSVKGYCPHCGKKIEE